MHKIAAHSKSSLFLMEMLLSLLILALACTACVRLFAAARLQRQMAREYNHIQELIISAGELLEGWDGQSDSFALLLPYGEKEGDVLVCCYDQNWQNCSLEAAAYRMELLPTLLETEKQAQLTFYNASGTELYGITLRFPFQGKEESS